jgi:hypothetical protein
LTPFHEGEQQTLLHYSTPLNELRLGKDPVALDVYSLQELDRQRAAAHMPARKTKAMELYDNAAVLGLGVSDPARIQVEEYVVPTP